MGLLDKLWDDVVAGPQPERGLGRLRRGKTDLTGLDEEAQRRILERGASIEFQSSEGRVTQSIHIKPPPLIRAVTLSDETLASTPTAGSPVSPSMVSPGSREKVNVWRSVFHPGSGSVKNMERQGSARFDNVTPNSSSPSVYDWMYQAESRSKYR